MRKNMLEVHDILRGWGGGIPLLPLTISSASRLSSLVSHLSLLLSPVSPFHHPPPLFTPINLKPRWGGVRLAASNGGG